MPGEPDQPPRRTCFPAASFAQGSHSQPDELDRCVDPRDARTKAQSSLVLPAAPMLEAIRRRGGLKVVLRGRRNTSEGRRLARAYHHAKARGRVSVAVGDELACRCLGVHPSAVWGAQFWAGTGTGAQQLPPAPPARHMSHNPPTSGVIMRAQAADDFYEWLLSDAPAARQERLRRRADHATRGRHEREQAATWCQRTLANPDAPRELRDLAEVLTRTLDRDNAREAADEAVPDDLWVHLERHHYTRSRRVTREPDYRYPARYLGAQAADQPIPHEPVAVAELRPGQLAAAHDGGPTYLVSAVQADDTGVTVRTAHGDRLRYSYSAWVLCVRDQAQRVERSTEPPGRHPQRSTPDLGWEL